MRRPLLALLALSFTLVRPSAQQPPGPVPAPPAGEVSIVPISVSGDPATRFSLVLMSDGYTAAEMPRYRAHVDKHLNVLWSIEPFRSYRNYINVYSIEIPSAESGITCDPEVRQQRKTPLGTFFQDGCTNPNARGILVNQNAARDYARRATPHFDQILVLANTGTYGGIGGRVATTSGGNALGVLITPHELGHSLGQLQDEYTYYQRGVAGGPYKGKEPDSFHHTLLSEQEMKAQQKKWFRWLGDESESGGRIGRFEGGQYMTTGIWRPSKHSMMISIGYYFDQVSRERMVHRISEQLSLIAASRAADAPVGPNEVLWIETAHPNYHELDIAWTVDGKPAESARNVPYLQTNVLKLAPGAKIGVTVTDPTPFVRDPESRRTVLTATRTWTMGDTPAALPAVKAAFAGSTPVDRAVGGSDVVYVTTSEPGDRALHVRWTLDGKPVPREPLLRSLPLAPLRLTPGTHRLTASLSDPRDRSVSETRSWTIDNTPPSVRFTLSTPIGTKKEADGTPHFIFSEEFTMKLEPEDDQKGYVVAEFRVNGDGWHHYYGWPDAPEGTPFKFTPRGTNIKELIYGSLSSEGLSPQPWEPRAPGYGTHRIEYRAIDAAGNIGHGRAFLVTVEERR